MTVSNVQTSTTSAGSGLALGVDMYFDFLRRQVAVARMFMVAGTRLATAIFSESGVELVVSDDRVGTDRSETVTGSPIGQTMTDNDAANGRHQQSGRLPRIPEQPTRQLRTAEPSTGSRTLHRPAAHQRPPVDRVFDEIVGYLVAADITGDGSNARGLLVP